MARKNGALKANQRTAKKAEKRRSIFDFKTKIYKLVRLESEDLIDLSDNKDTDRGMAYDIPLVPLEILAPIRDSGIVGLSGGGFPVEQKIETTISSVANEKHLIVNAVECDPGLLHDEWLLRNRWEQIKLGIQILCRCIHFQTVIVASRQPMNFVISESSVKYDYPQLDCFYPIGEEHILINELLKIQLRKKDVPAEHGILVLNVQTILAIGQAVTMNRKFVERYLTVANLTNGQAKIVKASFGADALKLLQEVFGKNDKAEAFIGSGVMSSHKICDGEKIAAITNFIAYAKPIKFADPITCQECGDCQRKCPLSIPVAGLMKAAKFGQSIPQDVTDSCIGCNACTYFCKSGINASQFINRKKPN